jgi:hypothetical protein
MQLVPKYYSATPLGKEFVEPPAFLNLCVCVCVCVRKTFVCELYIADAVLLYHKLTRTN